MGHMMRNCRSLKREQSDDWKADDQNTTATASSFGSKHKILLCASNDYGHISDRIIEWVVDSAASYHCSPKWELFTTYKVGDLGSVKRATIGVLQKSSGLEILLYGPIHVQQHWRMSTYTRVVARLEVFFGAWHRRIPLAIWQQYMEADQGIVVITRGSLSCKLHKSSVTVYSSHLNAVKDAASLNLWHKRLAYMS